MHAILKQEHVPDRHALARKLGSKRPQPLSKLERAAIGREQVRNLLTQGLSPLEIATTLNEPPADVYRWIERLKRPPASAPDGRFLQR